VSLLVGKDLRTLRRTPVLLGVLLAYPLVIAALVGLVAGYSNSKPRVAFVDEDGLPARLVVGTHSFNVRTTIDAVAQNVDLVTHVAGLGAARAGRRQGRRRDHGAAGLRVDPRSRW
jgi:hypothetical protein